jgi:hypothetical protein
MIVTGFFSRVVAESLLLPPPSWARSRRQSGAGLYPAFSSEDDRDFVDLAIAAIFLNLFGFYATNHGWT